MPVSEAPAASTPLLNSAKLVLPPFEVLVSVITTLSSVTLPVLASVTRNDTGTPIARFCGPIAAVSASTNVPFGPVTETYFSTSIDGA